MRMDNHHWLLHYKVTDPEKGEYMQMFMHAHEMRTQQRLMWTAASTDNVAGF
jgi:hypothetical protein